jgi:hypothetical protein
MLRIKENYQNSEAEIHFFNERLEVPGKNLREYSKIYYYDMDNFNTITYTEFHFEEKLEERIWKNI